MASVKYIFSAAVIIAIFRFGSVFAEEYPAHTVHLIAATAPGGGVDLTARILAQQLSEDLRQSVIVENKPGASNMVGAQYVSAAKPDGYILLFASSTLAIAPSLMAHVPIDIERDLTPITMAFTSPNVMVATKSVMAQNPRELVAWIKQHPDEFRWGISEVGSPDHLAIEQFDRLAGIRPQILPKGTRGPVAQLLSGEISAMLTPPATVRSYIESGQLKALGIASQQPVDVMPDMPTVASFGFPGFESGVWFAVWGPKGMPKDLVLEIQHDVQKSLANAALHEKSRALGVVVTPSNTPEEFGAYFSAQLATYSKLMKELKIGVAN